MNSIVRFIFVLHLVWITSVTYILYQNEENSRATYPDHPCVR